MEAVFSFLDIPYDAVLLACMLAIWVVCIFEFINGFHDTANAVATVIYTKTLKPFHAIIWSGLWNFLGVYIGGVTVAMGIISVVPLADLAVQGIWISLLFLFAILLASIIWNLATRYVGIPCSSSHTLIGAMIGASLGFTFWYGGVGPDWGKLAEIGLSLLLSPLVGFFAVVGCLRIIHHLWKKHHASKEPIHERHVPGRVRAMLVTTCGLVSFSHGSNDGQKGVGLIMLVLFICFPLGFSLNPRVSDQTILQSITHIQEVTQNFEEPQLQVVLERVSVALRGSAEETMSTREDIQKIQQYLKSIVVAPVDGVSAASTEGEKLSPQQKAQLSEDLHILVKSTDYAPTRVILLISLSLGVGTMIGRKRIVVTIGEKIGKTHLTYLQGAVSEAVAASTIGLSTWIGLPVSTTHVLSSAIAGSMVAEGGAKNIQKSTIMHIVRARVLTVPVTIALAYLIFMAVHVAVR